MTLPVLPELTIGLLKTEARAFAEFERTHAEPRLFGVNNGKTIGTYLEAKFKGYLGTRYSFSRGNAASGIDLPGLMVDIKTTSYIQPQSSSPFSSARQKIYGLGYCLLVFVYSKVDDHESQTAILDIQRVVFIDAVRTADYQMTAAIIEALRLNGNTDDLVAIMMNRNLPVDDITARVLAEEIIVNPPLQGYLTISNALQWRLQYNHAINHAGNVIGLENI
jgi:hypothetical protein